MLAFGADVSICSDTESHRLSYFSSFCFSTLVTISCVKYRKEIISFLKKGEGNIRQTGGQGEVSADMDWPFGSS